MACFCDKTRPSRVLPLSGEAFERVVALTLDDVTGAYG